MKLKIAVTADPFIPVPPHLYGGIERIIDMIVQGYIERGHEVTLIAHPDSKPYAGCRFIPYTSEQDRIISNTITITRAYYRHGFDLIHSFSRLLYLLPLLPLRVPKLMSYQREPSTGQIQKAMKIARKNTLSFTGCSNYISDQIKPYAPAYTVYNGVPLSRYHFNATIADDAPLVFLGRIEPIKGTHVAVEVAKNTGRKLIIAGNIPDAERSYFTEQIQPHVDGEQIQYIGSVNDQQKDQLLQNALALLMPIQWNEPFGIVMAEAMACGTPVIGFGRGSVPEVISNRKTGFVCRSTEEMENAVSQVHMISREEVRRSCEERFSDQKITEDYLHLYTHLISRSR